MKLSDLKIGDRVKLAAPMSNGASSMIPVEDVPVGTCGTVVWECGFPVDRFSQVTVQWDNGRTLGVLPQDVITRVEEVHAAGRD